MDEKTEELRDIFIDTTGADTVTESQEESRGSLADESDDPDRVRAVLAELHEADEPRTDLSLDEYETVTRLFFDDADDDRVAAELGVSPAVATQARLDCHLVRESDRDAPFDLSRLRSLVIEGVEPADCAERLGVDIDLVEQYLPVVQTDIASTRVNDRFRDELGELLSDEDLGERLAAPAREDGLEEATEDIETNVSF